MKKIAVIAGTGSLPLSAINAIQKQQIPFFVIALFPEDNGKQLIQAAGDAAVISQSAYKIGAIKKTLISENTTDLLFIGKVDKRMLLKKISYDWEFTKLASKLLYKGDRDIMELLVSTIEKMGITVLKQREVLSQLCSQPGVWTGSISSHVMADIKRGMELARTLSAHDVGQTVTLKDGMILSVEAIEGTDECIARGIALGMTDVIICKTCHEHQNDQYDIPTLGPQTLRTLPKGSVKALAWEAGRAFIAEKDEFIRIAQEKEIILVCLEAQSSVLT